MLNFRRLQGSTRALLIVSLLAIGVSKASRIVKRSATPLSIVEKGPPAIFPDGPNVKSIANADSSIIAQLRPSMNDSETDDMNSPHVVVPPDADPNDSSDSRSDKSSETLESHTESISVASSVVPETTVASSSASSSDLSNSTVESADTSTINSTTVQATSGSSNVTDAATMTTVNSAASLPFLVTDNSLFVSKESEVIDSRAAESVDGTAKGKMPSSIIALVTAITFAVVAIFGYVSLIVWRRYLEFRYGNRELLVNDLEFDTNDLRHFEL